MLRKKLWRTAWKYRAQFLSMIIMIAIGAGVFVGFNVEWNSIGKNTEAYFARTNFADYRVYAEKGFSAEDLSKVREIEGIEDATRWLAVNTGVKDTDKTLALNVAETYGISAFLVLEGAAYDPDSDGIWLSDKYAEANGVRLGDTIVVTYKNAEIAGTVAGLIKSSEYMVCVADDNRIMPDFSSFGYAFVTPKTLREAIGTAFYTQINVVSGLDKREAEARIGKALGTTAVVLSKEENMSYMAARSEMEEGQTMGSVLPVLFLLIGMLTMITTMHRITANEKTQIGTLKALGFRDARILRHYTTYGFLIGVIGAVLGVAVGYGIAAVIIGPRATMASYFDLPAWKLYMPWFCWPVLIGMTALLTAIGFLSVRKMLKGTAADVLRPYVPKKMKRTALEKTKLWQRFSFGTKWNFRDAVRHKARSAMTLIGVIGCMVLLVGGLGLRDTVNGFVDRLNNDVSNYRTRIHLAETVTNVQARELADRYAGDWLAASDIRYSDRAVSLEIYSVSHEKVRFLDKGNRPTKLGNEGAYVCLRIAAEGVDIGDMLQFTIYGSDAVYTIRVAGVLRSMMTESITMTAEYAQSVGIPYRIGAIFTDAEPGAIAASELISDTQSKQAVVDSFSSFMEIMNVMVLVFVLAAVVLGVVVLYNLGAMSYIERRCELATLKVVGFRDKRIGKLLISQNIWLTIVGILIGLPAGVGVLYRLLTMLAGEYELKMTVGVLTYCVSILLTLSVSLAVGFFIARKNRRINMVEALKGAE